MQVKDLMTPKPELINCRASAQDAARKMLTFGIGCMPVVDRGHLVGMLTDRDVTVRCVAAGLDPCMTSVQSIMTQAIVTCQEDADVSDAAHLMEKHALRRLVAVNARGKPVGIMSLLDLTQADDKTLVAEALKRAVATGIFPSLPHPD